MDRNFLDHLFKTDRRLPSSAQRHIPEPYTTHEFFYEKNVCVYCDGSVHDEPQQKAADERIREELRVCGYSVVVIRHDEDLESRIRNHANVFEEAHG